MAVIALRDPWSGIYGLGSSLRGLLFRLRFEGAWEGCAGVEGAWDFRGGLGEKLRGRLREKISHVKP